MKKLFFIFATLVMSITMQAAKEVYTEFDAATGTLTYYYDDHDNVVEVSSFNYDEHMNWKHSYVYEYDEDGNPIPLPLEREMDEEGEEEGLDNDDTYYSSLTPEADVKDLEEEGLSIEDVGESEEEEE